MKPLFMFDTNIVSTLVGGRSEKLGKRTQAIAAENICVSAIVYGEIVYGLAYRPEAKALNRAAHAFFAKTKVLDWNKDVADQYGLFRAKLRRAGIGLGAIDLQIASHAIHANAVLVSADKAFRNIPGLVVEDWTSSA